MYKAHSILILGLIFFSVSCTSSLRFTSIIGEDLIDSEQSTGKALEDLNQITISKKISGLASYYSDKFHGRKTASGEIYNKNLLTAAHRTLPFGTLIIVTNLKNGKSVVVRVNDRGPQSPKRIIDLSRAAAEEIDMIYEGIAEVEIEIIK